MHCRCSLIKRNIAGSHANGNLNANTVFYYQVNHPLVIDYRLIALSGQATLLSEIRLIFQITLQKLKNCKKALLVNK